MLDICGDDGSFATLEPKHKIFLSHSGAQKLFVEYLCDELERCHRYPFFDLREESLPIGENFVKHIFAAIERCDVGIVILSEEVFTSKWPLMELAAMVDEVEKRKDFKLIPVFLRTSLTDFDNPENQERWQKCWEVMAKKNPGRVEVGKWKAVLKYIRSLNGLEQKPGLRELEFLKRIVDRICAIVPAEMRLEDSYIQDRCRLCNLSRT